MLEANKEIAAQYITHKRKWLIASDISYPIPGDYSNIDILAFDPKTNRYYDIEIKYRQPSIKSATNQKIESTKTESIQWIVDEFRHTPGRLVAICDYIGTNQCTKILITTKHYFGTTSKKRTLLENAFFNEMAKSEFANSEIWYFENIIPELVETISTDGVHNTLLLQVIRLLKTYIH